MTFQGAELERRPWLWRGCGVTAHDLKDAVAIISKTVFDGGALPIHQVVEDIDVSSLDQGHVLPNMASPLRRGVWFPLGFERE